nr:MAG TPA: hypothetical protein [Bacteriophage sp.]
MLLKCVLFCYNFNTEHWRKGFKMTKKNNISNDKTKSSYDRKSPSLSKRIGFSEKRHNSSYIKTTSNVPLPPKEK